MRSPPVSSPDMTTQDTITSGESKSVASYKSTQSSRSSVLERAREYNRRIEDSNNNNGGTPSRARSLERNAKSSSREGDNDAAPSTRSHSTGRKFASSSGNRPTTRERAMASVEHDTRRSHNKTDPPSSGSRHSTNESSSKEFNQQPSNGRSPVTPRSRTSPTRTPRSQQQQQDEAAGDEANPIVTPELLVDALSGHEDGLLAIAEKLMEHYDEGYDVMGEAIIDAFADVQKLFQHVVEAAHMEGAAFESSRREAEMEELRKQKGVAVDDTVPAASPPTKGAPSRHDEYIDPDVKEALTEAIRQGAPLRQANKHTECFQLYEAACQSSSAMLPVDSDHRGRLQLSIARAESMSPDRACAILRYAMDDVLRSGLRAGNGPKLPDPSKRGDCVLVKPKDHPSQGSTGAQTGVVQSSEEELASLVEEMKEVLGAPVYDNTPLQSVSQRFWIALSDAQRNQMKNEEKLEQNLGKLKGEYLLAKAEWEEKLTSAQESTVAYKQKYMKMKQSKSEEYMEQARTGASNLKPPVDFNMEGLKDTFETSRPKRGPGSVASSVSGLAQHAKTLVGSFACAGNNEDTSVILEQELGDSRRRGRSTSVPRSSGKFASADSDEARAPRRQYADSSNETRSRSRRSGAPSRSARRSSSATRPFQEV